jgi:hypothetical protein
MRPEVPKSAENSDIAAGGTLAPIHSNPPPNTYPGSYPNPYPPNYHPNNLPTIYPYPPYPPNGNAQPYLAYPPNSYPGQNASWPPGVYPSRPQQIVYIDAPSEDPYLSTMIIIFILGFCFPPLWIAGCFFIRKKKTSTATRNLSVLSVILFAIFLISIAIPLALWVFF